MTKFVSLRIEKLNQSDLATVRDHNQRLDINDKLIYDPSKTHNNICLHGDGNIDDLVAKRLNDLNVKTVKSGKNKSVVAVEMIISATPTAFRDDPYSYGEYDQQKTHEWAKRNMEFLHKKYGDNLIRVDLHLDEATPHLHAVITPIEQKERSRRRTKAQIKAGEKSQTYTANVLNAKKLFDRDALVLLQTEAAEVVADLGIERGVHGSRAKHTTVAQMMHKMREIFSKTPNYEPPDLNEINIREPKSILTNAKQHRESESKRIRTFFVNQLNKLYRECVKYRRQSELYKSKYEHEKHRTDILIKHQNGDIHITDLLEQNINDAREMQKQITEISKQNGELISKLKSVESDKRSLIERYELLQANSAALVDHHDTLENEHKSQKNRLATVESELKKVTEREAELRSQLLAKSERLEKFEAIRARGNNKYSREIGNELGR